MEQHKYVRISVLMLILAITFTGCKKVGENEITTLKIEDPVRHYSPVMQGTKQEIALKVTNTGKEPLVLKDVMTSCGCTTAKFPTYAIAPGNSADIELEYDSNKNTGYTAIYTTITANTAEKAHNVFFDINVVPDSHYTKDYEEIYRDSKNETFTTTRDQVDDDTHIKAYSVN